MKNLNLQGFQLLLMSLKLLPSYCLICFSAVLLIFRFDIGLGKTPIDKITMSLTGNPQKLKSNAAWKNLEAQYYNVSAFMMLLLSFGGVLMLHTLLQFTGLSKPEFLFKFYPDYRSHKLKRRKAAMETSKYVHNVGFISFVLTLALGSMLTLTSRIEITSKRKEYLAISLREAMTDYLLNPWRTIDMSKTLDVVQTNFSCCGINGYQDYDYLPRPARVPWKDVILERTRAHAKKLLRNPKLRLVQKKQTLLPISCCVTTETGKTRRCNSTADMHKLGCFVRVLQYMKFRQMGSEHWSFYTGACIAVIGTMAYWVQIM